jgi:hypothetical protein
MISMYPREGKEMGSWEHLLVNVDKYLVDDDFLCGHCEDAYVFIKYADYAEVAYIEKDGGIGVDWSATATCPKCGETDEYGTLE